MRLSTFLLTLMLLLGACADSTGDQHKEQTQAAQATTEMAPAAADEAEYAAVQEAIVSHYADYLFAIEAQRLYEVPGMLIGRDSKVSFSYGSLYAVDFEDVKLGEGGRRIVFFDESAALSYLYTPTLLAPYLSRSSRLDEVRQTSKRPPSMTTASGPIPSGCVDIMRAMEKWRTAFSKRSKTNTRPMSMRLMAAET